MRADRYTKVMLTIIAGALLYLCALASGESAFAQGGAIGSMSLGRVKPQPVVVVGWGTVRSDGEVMVTTRQDPTTRTFQTDPTMPVKIQDVPEQPLTVRLAVTPQHPLPVGITGIKAGTDWEPIRAKVEPAPMQTKPGVPSDR